MSERSASAGERSVKLACEAVWKVFGPGAYKAIRNFKIDNKTMGNLIVEIDLDGKKLEDVVAQWLKDNEATWKKWTQ